MILGCRGDDVIDAAAGTDAVRGGAINDVFRVTDYDEASSDRFDRPRSPDLTPLAT